MARCSHPHYTLDLGVKENGKRALKFVGFRPDLSSLKQLSERYGKESIVPLPCGHCVNCYINKAKEWAVRCVLEALDHEENYFITLTYDNEHLPKDGKVSKEEMQRFFKRLRQEFGECRYLCVGEYGKANKRPHYHAIVFGLHIPDANAVLGHPKSVRFSKVWPYGEYSLDEVTYASANYVAQYTTNKLFKNVSNEFLLVSNRPGLGYNWCVRNIPKILEYDKVYGYFGSCKEARLPRYFDKVAELLDEDGFKNLKMKRAINNEAYDIHNMIKHSFDRVEKLLAYQEQITLNEFIRRLRGVRKL